MPHHLIVPGSGATCVCLLQLLTAEAPAGARRFKELAQVRLHCFIMMHHLCSLFATYVLCLFKLAKDMLLING